MATQYIPDDLSIVIATYNRPQRLLEMLKWINPQMEIIVADDGTLPSLKRQLPSHVKLYTHEHGGNRVSTCRNQGARLATKPKILFLDDDVTPHGLCFAAQSLALEMYDISFGLLPREKWLPHTDNRLLFYMRDDQTLWNFGWSGNMAVRANVFAELGGFDAETFNGAPDEPAHGFEDIDFARRAQELGKRMTLNRLAMAHHPSPHVSEEPSPGVLRNQRRYQEKWGEVVA